MAHTAEKGEDTVRGRVESFVGTCAEQGQRRLSNLARSVEGQVKERPLPALLATAGAGLLLGFLISVMFVRR